MDRWYWIGYLTGLVGALCAWFVFAATKRRARSKMVWNLTILGDGPMSGKTFGPFETQEELLAALRKEGL